MPLLLEPGGVPVVDGTTPNRFVCTFTDNDIPALGPYTRGDFPAIYKGEPGNCKAYLTGEMRFQIIKAVIANSKIVLNGDGLLRLTVEDWLHTEYAAIFGTSLAVPDDPNSLDQVFDLSTNPMLYLSVNQPAAKHEREWWTWIIADEGDVLVADGFDQGETITLSGNCIVIHVRHTDVQCQFHKVHPGSSSTHPTDPAKPHIWHDVTYAQRFGHPKWGKKTSRDGSQVADKTGFYRRPAVPPATVGQFLNMGGQADIHNPTMVRNIASVGVNPQTGTAWLKHVEVIDHLDDLSNPAGIYQFLNEACTTDAGVAVAWPLGKRVRIYGARMRYHSAVSLAAGPTAPYEMAYGNWIVTTMPHVF